MKSKFLFTTAIFAALGLWASAHAADKLGNVESAKKLIGREIQLTQGDKAGELKDLVVDLESGRVLYGILADNKIIPAASFKSSTEARLVIHADQDKLGSAPRFTRDHETKLGDTAFVKESYQHFGHNLNWPGASFNNAHRASDLVGMKVKDSSDQSIGDINDLAIDLAAQRVTFVIFGAGGILGVAEKQYVIPPNAFTLASDNKSLVAGIDKARLSSAPQFQNWGQLSDNSFSLRAYQHYGKQPYWSGSATLAPTGRDQNRVYTDEPIRPNQSGLGRDRISRDRDNDPDDDGIRVRGERANRNPVGAGARARGQFADVEEVRRLIGMNVQTARGRDLGKLTDMLIDLEAGRVVYAILNPSGRGGAKALLPADLTFTANDKALRFNGDEMKFTSSPVVDRKDSANEAKVAAGIYAHYGEQHDWFHGSRNFANAHYASELLRMKVNNVQDEHVGQVQNLMVDLSDGRVIYVILSAAQVVGRGDHLFAMPPNAFTQGKSGETLVTSVDKAKLEGAPRFDRANLRELTTPARAEEIYRYYGKQAYWNSGELTPTGRPRGR